MYDRSAIFDHPLKNQWFALRHGQSKANAAELIVSDPGIGTLEYGLTETGKSQVLASIQQSLADSQLPSNPRIVSSDFTRARETAEIAADTIATTHDIVYTADLRERFFGDWDLTASSNYEKVWDDDATDPAHSNHGVESVTAVAARSASVVEAIESEYSDQTFILTSHGDTLQILECVFRNLPLSDHRSLPGLGVAELRRLSGPHEAS